MKKLLISILALICVGLRAQNAAITSGSNLVVSDGKMVVYDLTDTIANFGTSTQSGAIDQITTIFNITPGYNVYVDWNDGDGGHLIVADGTDKSMTSNFTVSDTTYHIYVYGDTQNGLIRINATFTRGSSVVNAVITVDSDGASVWTDWYPYDAGFGLTIDSVTISSNEVRLNYTTTSTGTAVTMNTNYNRVMK